MLSLDKCYAEGDLMAWASTFEGKVVVDAQVRRHRVRAALRRERAAPVAGDARRRRGGRGHHRQRARDQGHPGTRQVGRSRRRGARRDLHAPLGLRPLPGRGEIEPRNLAAGAIKQKDASKSAAYELSFAAYDLLGMDEPTQEAEPPGSSGSAFRRSTTWSSRATRCCAATRSSRACAPRSTTRSTASSSRPTRSPSSGASARRSHHPRHSLAYKFQGDSGVSTLRDVEWSVARSGAITPVPIVDPVALSGVSVSRASLHNVALHRASSGSLRREGHARPAGRRHPERRGGRSSPGDRPVVVPTECPSCGTPVVREKDFLYCTEPRTCRSALIGRLSHFAATCDILRLRRRHPRATPTTPGSSGPPPTSTRSGGRSSPSSSGAARRSGGSWSRRWTHKRTLDLATFLRALGCGDSASTWRASSPTATRRSTRCSRRR